MSQLVKLFCVTLSAVSIVAGAADLDVKGAQDSYERQRRIAAAAETRMQQALRELQSAQSRLASAKSDETSARNRLASAQSRLVDLDATITRLEREIIDLESDLRTSERRLTELQGQINRHEAEVRRLQHRREAIIRQIEDVDQRIADLQGKPDSETQLQRLRERRATLVRECDDVDDKIRQERQELSSAEQNYRQTERKISSLESDIREKRDSIANSERQRTTLVNEVADARDDLRRAQDALSFAQRDLQLSQSSYQSAKSDYESEEAEASRLYAYYLQVKANYDSALADVYRQADFAANSHAQQEAAERAPVKGQQDGVAAAGAAGLSKGEKDGNVREEVKGYLDGKKVASTDPVLASLYQTGIRQGQDLASAKALSENFPLGYNDALRAHFGGAPGQVETVDISSEISAQPGGSGNFLSLKEKVAVGVANPGFVDPREPVYQAPVYTTPGVTVPLSLKTYYSPPCSGLVLAEFEPMCRSRYANSFQNAFDANYQSIYRQNYRKEFEAGVGSAYQQALAKSYPASFTKGRNRAAGEVGILDGFAKALPGAQTVQYANGKAALRTDLAQGAVVIVRGASLEETSGDGLLTPGEALKLSVVIDNYGLEASGRGKLRMTLVNQSGVGQLNFQVRELPALKENTRTTLTGVLSGPVTTEFVGDKLSLKANIEVQVGGAWKVLSTVEPTGETHFPLELAEISLPHNPKVNEEITATLKYINRTTQPFAASKLKFDSKPQFVVMPSPEANLPELAPGESTEVSMLMKPGPWVPSNGYVKFISELALADGRAMSQAFAKSIVMERNTSIAAFDTAGKPIASSRLRVKAGSTFGIQAKLVYHAKTNLNGPFRLKTSTQSVPQITIAGGSTTKVEYPSLSPTYPLTPITVYYTVPASLKGREEWVMLQADEGKNTNHVLMIYLDIQ